MHFTFGIRLNVEDQMVGMDKLTHGEMWHGPTRRRRSSLIYPIPSEQPKNPGVAVVEMGAVPPATETQNQQK